MEGKIKFSWQAGLGSIFNADAQLVGEEIMEIGEEATAQQILDKGRDESTELHKCFEWDDGIAAEKYRLHQARSIVRMLVLDRTDEQKENNAPEIRAFRKTDLSPSSGYKPMVKIVTNDDEYQKMLKIAYAELHSIKLKYQHLEELDYILSLSP